MARQRENGYIIRYSSHLVRWSRGGPGVPGVGGRGTKQWKNCVACVPGPSRSACINIPPRYQRGIHIHGLLTNKARARAGPRSASSFTSLLSTKIIGTAGEHDHEKTASAFRERVSAAKVSQRTNYNGEGGIKTGGKVEGRAGTTFLSTSTHCRAVRTPPVYARD